VSLTSYLFDHHHLVNMLRDHWPFFITYNSSPCCDSQYILSPTNPFRINRRYGTLMSWQEWLMESMTGILKDRHRKRTNLWRWGLENGRGGLANKRGKHGSLPRT
jgi:hypothetical protein